MNRLSQITVLILCCISFSCNTEIDIPVRLPEPSAVLNASLSADSIIKAEVSHTNNAVPYHTQKEKPSLFINDARVEVFINNISKGIMEKGENPGQYFLPGVYPSANDKVRIEVQTNEYEPLSAEVNIPGQPEILSVDTQMIQISSPHYQGIVSVNVYLHFKEPKDEQNYYMLSVSGNEISHNEDHLFEEVEPYFLPGYAYYTNSTFYIFSDKLIYEDEYTLNFTLNSDSTSSIHLHAISESYYLYCRSKLLQWKQTHDPFGSIGLREPIPIYTNIQNGYGLLSAQQVTTYELVTFKQL